MKQTEDNARTQTAYPYWHNKPFLLSIQEINQPLSVLDDFFDFCSLAQARSRLHEWLFASFYGGEDQFTYFKERVEKLIEASWIIFQSKGKNLESEENPNKNLSDSSLFQDGALPHPIKRLSELFSRIQLKQLKSELQLWCEVALCNDGNTYDNGTLRNSLITFCHSFSSVMEALYLIHKNKNDAPGSQKMDKTNVQFSDNQKQEQLSVSKKQTLNPMKIVHEFCAKFDRDYVCAELWDILDAMLIAERKKSSPKNLPLVYECFLRITDIAYSLSQLKKRKKGNHKKHPFRESAGTCPIVVVNEYYPATGSIPHPAMGVIIFYCRRK